MRVAAGVAVAVIVAACAGHPAPRAQGMATAPPSAAERAVADLPPEIRETLSHSAAPPTVDLAAFQAEVQPLLMRRCAPCHAPGGRMYARMPFDDATTVVAHGEGILGRLKEPEEHALLERWLASAR